MRISDWSSDVCSSDLLWRVSFPTPHSRQEQTGIPMVKLDRYDLQILKTLATQGRITKSDLAKVVCLSVSPTWERVKRLETAGLIRGYRAVIDWNTVFPSSQVIVEVRLHRHTTSDIKRFQQHRKNIVKG